MTIDHDAWLLSGPGGPYDDRETPDEDEMSEQDFLEQERRIEQSYRDGFISLTQKQTALANLRCKWEAT